MHYDPVKDIFANIIDKSPTLRIIFYKILDLIFLRAWYVRRELKELRKVFGNRKINIYDAGTGYGQYSYFMSKNLQPNQIYAVDVKEDWINSCKNFFEKEKISNVSFALEDLTKINHISKFDLIISIDVMEHIEDDVCVFQNFYRALNEGGFLMINTPSIYGGSDVHEKTDESFISEHAREGYSPEDLKNKLSPIGFKIYKLTFTYGFWGDIAWRLGIKYPMMILKASKLWLIILPIYYLFTLPFTLFMMYLDYISNNKIGSGINLIVQK